MPSSWLISLFATHYLSLALSVAAPPGTTGDTTDFALLRKSMVQHQLMDRDIRDPRVLAAMAKVERHFFVPKDERPWAYEDHPLPIGNGQTISQPYIVALMSERLE